MTASLFYLVELVPSPDGFRERSLDNYGPYTSGAEAGAIAAELTRMRRNKVQPRRSAPSATWREEAAERLHIVLERMPSVRLYPPWTVKPIPDHFARMHASDDLVGFFEDAQHAAIDRLTYISPARYLMEFYPELSSRDVATMCAAFEGESTLCFARTPDEVEFVYRNGPNSCLKDEKGDVMLDDGTMHNKPRFFGGPDLAVAYLMRAGRLTARCVVHPDMKQHGRLYGDMPRLSKALNNLGYRQTRYFENVRLDPRVSNPKAVEDGAVPTYAVPYLDNIAGVVRCDDGSFRAMSMREAGDPDFLNKNSTRFLHKLEDGQYHLGRICPLMDRWASDRDFFMADDIDGFSDPVWVSRTGYDLRTFVCAKLNKRFLRNQERMVTVENQNGLWSGQAFDRFGFTCGYSRRRVDRDAVVIGKARDGTRMLAEYVKDYDTVVGTPVIYPGSTGGPPPAWGELPTRYVTINPNAVSGLNIVGQVNYDPPQFDPQEIVREIQRLQGIQFRRSAEVVAPAPAAPEPRRMTRSRVVIDANRLRGFRNHRAAFEAIEGRPYPQSATSKRNPRTGDVTITYDD